MNERPPVAEAESKMPEPMWRRALDNRWVMLVMLFFVTLFLGLPFLWMSRGFSTLGKIVTTIAVLIWTVLVFWAFWLIMVWCYTRIMDAYNPPF